MNTNTNNTAYTYHSIQRQSARNAVLAAQLVGFFIAFATGVSIVGDIASGRIPVQFVDGDPQFTATWTILALAVMTVCGVVVSLLDAIGQTVSIIAGRMLQRQFASDTTRTVVWSVVMAVAFAVNAFAVLIASRLVAQS
jgi:hypothetical protein